MPGTSKRINPDFSSLGVPLSSKQAEGTQKYHIHGSREEDRVTLEAVNGLVDFTLNIFLEVPNTCM